MATRLSVDPQIPDKRAVLFPGDEAAWRPKGDHLGRLRRLASCGRQTERGWNATAPRTGAILQVFERRGRARSSPDKAANPADAQIQAIRDGVRNDSRH